MVAFSSECMACMVGMIALRVNLQSEVLSLSRACSYEFLRSVREVRSSCPKVLHIHRRVFQDFLSFVAVECLLMYVARKVVIVSVVRGKGS